MLLQKAEEQWNPPDFLAAAQVWENQDFMWFTHEEVGPRLHWAVGQTQNFRIIWAWWCSLESQQHWGGGLRIFVSKPEQSTEFMNWMCWSIELGWGGEINSWMLMCSEELVLVDSAGRALWSGAVAVFPALDENTASAWANRTECYLNWASGYSRMQYVFFS